MERRRYRSLPIGGRFRPRRSLRRSGGGLVRYLAGVAAPALAFLDDEGEEVLLDADEAAALLALTDNLDAATVSACPTCRSRIVAVVALVDVLGEAPPFSRSSELVELADDAPTLHLYVRDLTTRCVHQAWRDPGYDEWREAIDDLVES
jgi:hypothetical protein